MSNPTITLYAHTTYEDGKITTTIDTNPKGGQRIGTVLAEDFYRDQQETTR